MSSGPTPRRAATPGRKPSSTMSARAQSSRPSSGSALRSQTTDSLPALSAASHCGAIARSGSPSGDSSRTTRAPRRSSSRLAKGPGRCRVRSTTRSPASGCTGANLHYGSSALTDSSLTTDKRRVLLEAAVRVFARRGFHAARVGDIAEEAGVAHGLLYHYFSSKEEVLETIFRETWSELLAAVRDVEESGEPAQEQIRQVAAILLRSWRRDPDLVRVLVREVTRSPELGRRVGDVGDAFAAIERIVRRGQEAGELRPELDARLTSVIFYGAIEELLTGWVLELLPDGDDDVARAEQTVVEIVTGGLAAERL